MGGLLYARNIKINDKISVRIPTVGEILDNDDEYFSAVSSFVATPFDMMVPLDSLGIDFTKVNEFDVFCLMFGNLCKMDTSLILEDIDMNNFKFVKNRQNDEIVLRDEENDIVIDRVIHQKIANCLRKMLNIPKNDKKPGNEEARKYLLERAKVKAKRRKKRPTVSPMEDYIVALVNTSEFPYNYETVRDVTIYQFYASMNQINHKISFEHLMHGYYSGNVKWEDVKPDMRTWMKIERTDNHN